MFMKMLTKPPLSAKNGTTADLAGNFWVLPEAKIRVIKAIRSDLAVIIETQTRSFRGKLSALPLKGKFWEMKLNLNLRRSFASFTQL